MILLGIALLPSNTITVFVALFRWVARKEQPQPATSKAPEFLLILTVEWAFLIILLRLHWGDWLSIDSLLDVLIAILVIFLGIVLLFSNTIVVFVALFRWLVRKERPHPVAFLPLVIMPVVHALSYEIPSRPAVTFYLHRDAFIALAESAVKEFQSTGRVYRLPKSPLL